MGIVHWGSCVMGFTKHEMKSPSSSSTSPCAHLKATYYNCFNRWYTDKFLKGQWDKEGCVSEWQKYRACLSENLNDKHLSRFLEAEIIPPDLGNQVHQGVSAPSVDGVS